MYRVEHDYEGDWLPGVREDLYTGENPEVLESPAVFGTREEADRYITTICGLMHCGGDREHFRIVPGTATDTDPIALPLSDAGHREADPHCTCPGCITHHFELGVRG